MVGGTKEREKVKDSEERQEAQETKILTEPGSPLPVAPQLLIRPPNSCYYVSL